MLEPVYDLAIAPMLHSLRAFDAIIGKAQAHVQADPQIAPETLVQARLYPNMRPLVFQVQVATDTAKGAAARLANRPVPSWPDEEKTFADLRERIGKAVDFLAGFEPGDFAGWQERPIELKFPSRTVQFTGPAYVAGFVLPNFYFHMTTAYSILRHNGVPLGKNDFLGA